MLCAGLALGKDVHYRPIDADELAGGLWLLDGSTSAKWKGFQDTPCLANRWAIEGALGTSSDDGAGGGVWVSQLENFERIYDWSLAQDGTSGVKYHRMRNPGHLHQSATHPSRLHVFSALFQSHGAEANRNARASAPVR